MQSKIFLTGATGYIGSAIADALLAAGQPVIGLARSEEAARKLRAKGITPFEGDLRSPVPLAKAAEASDGVIHAGTTNDGRIDREAISAMANALRATLKPFIYTSGVWILGDTAGKIADETWEVNPAALAAWRPEVENLVIAAARVGVRSVVIRPGVVYGRGGGIPADFVKSAQETGAARYVGSGDNHWPVIHVDDLADLYVRALGGEGGTLFHATDGSAFQVRQIAEAASPTGRTESWPLEEARKTLGAYADALALDQLVSPLRAIAAFAWLPSSPTILDDLRQGSYTR